MSNVSHTVIELISGAGTVEVTVDVNLLEASDVDTAFVRELISAVRMYRRAQELVRRELAQP